MKARNVLLVLSLYLATSNAEHKWRIDAVPYYGYVSYDDISVKESSTLLGSYFYIGYGLKHLLEAEYDLALIDFDGSFNFTQHDVSAVYTNFSKSNWKFRVGSHHIFSDDPLTDGAYSIITGAHYYIPYKWDLGLDFYYSDYGDFVTPLDVFQASPHYGFNFLKSEKTMMRSDTTLHYIWLSDEIGLNEKYFLSIEQKFTLYAFPWSFGINAWTGEQTFAMRNGGFTTYNLSELHKSGFGGEIRFVFKESSNSAITVKIKREEFQDFSTRLDTSSTMFQLLYGFTF